MVKGPRDLTKVRFSEKIYYYFELIRARVIQVFDDIYTPYLFIVGANLHRIIEWLSSLFARSVTEFGERSLPYKFVFAIVTVSLAIPMLILLLFLSIAVILIGGAVASIVGLRNIANYSVAEQVVAWIPIVIVLGLVPYMVSDIIIYRLSSAFIFAIALLGLDFVFGQCGILTLGHSAFVLIGGYVTVWLTNGAFGYHVPFALAVPIAATVTAGLSLILAAPSIRIKDHYLVVVTLAFALAVPKLLKSRYLSNFSGFKMGGLTLEMPVLPKWLENTAPIVWQFYWITFFALILIFVAYNLKHHSQIGRAFRAIKCDVEVASILGVSTVKYKLLAFALSAFYGAFAGGLGLLLIPFIGPDTHPAHDSIEYLVGLVVGGPGSIIGSIYGGVYLAFEQSIATFLSRVAPRGEYLLSAVHGVILILVVYFAPGGLAQIINRFFGAKTQGATRRWQYFLKPPPDYDLLERRKPTTPAAKPSGKSIT